MFYIVTNNDSDLINKILKRGVELGYNYSHISQSAGELGFDYDGKENLITYTISKGFYKTEGLEEKSVSEFLGIEMNFKEKFCVRTFKNETLVEAVKLKGEELGYKRITKEDCEYLFFNPTMYTTWDHDPNDLDPISLEKFFNFSKEEIKEIKEIKEITLYNGLTLTVEEDITFSNGRLSETFDKDSFLSIAKVLNDSIESTCIRIGNFNLNKGNSLNQAINFIESC